MKKLMLIITAVTLAFGLSACTDVEPKLLGEEEITIEVGDDFTDPGTTESSKVAVSGTVDTDTVGTYILTYSYVFDSEAKELTRTVYVVDTQKPTITVNPLVIETNVGVVYTDPVASATDGYDGDISENIVVVNNVDLTTAGEYTITYDASDASGNEADQVVVTVTVLETLAAPVITLLGEQVMNLWVGDDFTDPGATALDNEETDITESITTTGIVDTSVAGTYYINYDVTDSNNLSATTITRTVIVGELDDPVLIMYGDNTITITEGQTWTEPGIEAYDIQDGDITDQIIITGSVDENTPGTYEITYSITDSHGATGIMVRTVTVEPLLEAPVVILQGDAEINVRQGDPYNEPGYTATDVEDGDITSAVVVTGTVDTSSPGTYTLEYTVTDSDNLTSETITRTVVVYEYTNTKPVLTLNGDEVISILVDTPYVELGASVVDDHDNLDLEVWATEFFDTSVPGTYTIQYGVTDFDGLDADPIYRTVNVIISEPSQFNFIYIDLDTNYDVNDMFIELGITPDSTITVDTSVLGETTVSTDKGTTKVIIVDFANTDTVFYPGSVLIGGYSSTTNWSENRLSIPNDMRCKVTFSSTSDSYFNIVSKEWDEIAAMHVINETMDRYINIDSGLYNISMHQVFGINDIYTVKLEIIDYTAENEIQTIPLEQSETYFTLDESFEFSFEVTEQETLYVGAVTYSGIKLEIFDSSYNLIVTKYGDYEQMADDMRIYAVGTYYVKVTNFDYPDAIKVTVSEYNRFNTSMYTAKSFSVNTETQIEYYDYNNWFRVHIYSNQEGLYEFNFNKESAHWYDVVLYDEYGLPLEYSVTSRYLTEGSYYFHITNGHGEMTLSVDEITITPSINNTKELSNPIDETNVNEIFFDGNNTSKWYKFKVIGEGLGTITIHNMSHFSLFEYTIYKDDTIYFEGSYNNTIYLEGGQYYIEFKGISNTIELVSFHTTFVEYGPSDETNPTIITLEEKYEFTMMQLEPHYYEITVTEDMLLRIDGESLGNLYIILYKNNQRYYLDELYLEQWYPSYINLTPGTYSIKVFSRSSSIDNYAITFRNGNNIQSNFSLDKENPTEINSESDMTYYVSNFLDPFYQEITITEPTMINGWFENIMLLNVYKDNTIIEQHNAEVSDILPIVLEPGTYLFEYYSFENGVVFAEELFFTPIHYSPGTMTAPTQVEGFRLFEVINDQNPMQAYEITITEDGIYDVEAWSDDYFEYFIVDSNNNTVCNEDYMNSLMYLEEGTYTLYIHQPHQSEFVNLYISNKTRLLASETITNTVLIPEGNEFRFIIDTEVTNYLRLRVVDETYLDIDVYGFTYEVLDSIGNVVDYTNLDFGTYVIKITPLSETITSKYQYVDITIRNIKGYTFDNTIATAKEIEFTKTYSGMITDPLEQHWYTFTLDSRDAVYISGQGYNASIELYDASENLISTENHHYYFLDAATYYIRVLDSEETYILTVSNKHYNDIPNTFTEAQEINIFNNFNYQTYLEDSNDVDYYTFTLTEDKLLYFWYDFNTFDLYDGTQTHIKTLSAYSYNVLPQGQYYIKVSGQQYPYYSIGITDRTDMLPGDSKTNAMEIKLDDTIYVFERDDTTNDFFYFDLIVDTNIYLSGVSDIYLYDESDNLITDYNLTAGRYYIQVDSVYTETYNLRVGTYIYEGEQIADDIDAPSTNPIRINTEVFYFFYHITDMLEKDHFVTILEENTCIYFDGDGVVINVYDSANNIVIANENIYDINCLSTGEYTIIFEAEENDTEYWIEYYELDHLDLSIDENNPTIYHEYEIIDTYINSTNPIYLEVTITNEKVFYVDINGNAYVEIYTTDSNPEKLFGSDINTFFHAIPGTYTIIIIPMDSTELRFHLNDTMDTILPEDIT